ncbi:hypothetical protein DAI22_11g066466 [Oryza sativa Japonica Group]|nr:hypothetical protein DAI22_11g066466 [Oryza sativa Japonica Group]
MGVGVGFCPQGFMVHESCCVAPQGIRWPSKLVQYTALSCRHLIEHVLGMQLS